MRSHDSPQTRISPALLRRGSRSPARDFGLRRTGHVCAGIGHRPRLIPFWFALLVSERRNHRRSDAPARIKAIPDALLPLMNASSRTAQAFLAPDEA